MMQQRKTTSRSISRRSFNLLTACLPLALVAGCQLPGSGPAPRRVRLSPAEDFPPNLPAVAWSLIVNEPDATLSLNTAKIAIGTREDVKYVANGEWASRAPEMVMELLVQSFKNSNTILTVGDRRARVRPDFNLELQMTKFHVESTGADAGTIRVGLDATLVQHPRRNPLASFSFESSADAEPLSLDNIVAAFDESLHDVMEQIVEWTLQTGANAPSAS